MAPKAVKAAGTSSAVRRAEREARAAEREAREAERLAILAEAEEAAMEEIECELEADGGVEEWRSDSESESITSCRSDGWAPAHVNKAMPVPDGLPGFVRWSATLLTMPRFRECRYTFKECCLRAFKDEQMPQYLKFISSRYGSDELTEVVVKDGRRQYKHPIQCQARDLACYLKACNFHEELDAYKGSGKDGGYKRQFKGLSVNP